MVDPRAAGLAKYGTGADLTKKQGMSTTKKWLIFAGVVVALIVIAIAVAIPLLKVHDDQQQHAATVPGTGPDGKVLTSGGNGTLIRMDNGTEFMYLNGAYSSLAVSIDPLLLSFLTSLPLQTLVASGEVASRRRRRKGTVVHAAANETWDYVNDQILGVNLGGWLVIERTLDVIRVFLSSSASQRSQRLSPAFGILNEPNLPVGIGMDNIRRFYVETYAMFRNITGFGDGKGPMMVIHDGFMGLNSFTNFLQGGDRIGWDLHPYICFIPPFGPRDSLVESACNGFMGNTDQGLSQFGVTMAGEYSLANNDCGLFLNGPFQASALMAPGPLVTCKSKATADHLTIGNSSNASTKQKMKDGALAQMQAFRNHFFWTWKIGDSLRTNAPVNPNWSYKLGWEQGWMPLDPHGESQGACSKLQPSYPAITRTALTWASTFADYQTGAASTYAPDTVSYSWPPPSMASSGTATLLTAIYSPLTRPPDPL
ncbi:hypothetical protein L7F22_068540 [Adiantum nelumboides]|nr:hypothetical protein [Adiantum nelumboides]